MKSGFFHQEEVTVLKIQRMVKFDQACDPSPVGFFGNSPPYFPVAKTCATLATRHIHNVVDFIVGLKREFKRKTL